MTVHSKAALRMGGDWQRYLRAGLLLLAFALFLQPLAHANLNERSAQPGTAAASVPQPDATFDTSSDSKEACAERRHESNQAGSSSVDCCQVCLAAAIPPEAPSLHSNPNSDRLGSIKADLLARDPEEVLRPPRLITFA